MSIKRSIWGLHGLAPIWLQRTFALTPFVSLVLLYVIASDYRLEINPQDKLLPSLGQISDSVERLAFNPDPRTGDYILLKDTLSSLSRLGIGIGLASITGLLLGLNIGLIPATRHLLMPFMTFISIVPPLAILPILFITFGVDELAKVMLIFIGTFPLITRDIVLTVRTTPAEQITKALTLGATTTQVIYRIVMPQVLPKLIDTVRLSLGAGWLFLIASEAIASTDGLGYRIFLVRRYLAMDVIIPYVLWITFLGFVIDWLLQQLIAKRFPWYRR
ncbi:MAG: ABC transporter permease subunit [Gammaproteobacteria bacterium]|nr:ABC transporter permease subunit [Gammaproteobacteria bacterium]